MFTKKKLLLLLILIGLFISTANVHAETSQWYKKGQVNLTIVQEKNGTTENYANGNIVISRKSPPDWEAAKNNSFVWNFEISGKNISLDKKQYSTWKKYSHPENKQFLHSAQYPNDNEQFANGGYAGYNGLFCDVVFTMPRGYRYKVDSLVVNKPTETAFGFFLPPAAYNEYAKTDTKTLTRLCMHAANAGLMTYNGVHHSGGGWQLTLEPNKTKVSFDSNGGNGSMSPQDVTYNTKVCLPVSGFSKKNKIFAGWNTKKDGSGTFYADKADITTSFPAEKEVTLYAQWKNPYGKITYNGNGSTGGNTPQSDYEYSVTNTLSQNKFVKRGYDFAGWYTKPSGGVKIIKENTKTLFPTGNGTLYAHWTKKQVQSISFDKNIYHGIVGQTIVPKVIFVPDDVMNKSYTITSTNDNIVHIKNNAVYCNKGGKVKITAKAANGKTATAWVDTNTQNKVFSANNKKKNFYLTVKLISLTSSSAKFSSKTNYNYKRFRVYLKAPGKKYSKVADKKKISTYTAKKLKPGKKYRIKVQVLSGGKWKSKVMKFMPGTIRDLQIKSASAEQITLFWRKVSKVKGYEIYRKVGTGSYKKIATVKKPIYADKKIKLGTTYKYKVRAYTKKKKYPFSNVVSRFSGYTNKQAQFNYNYIQNDLKKNKEGSIWYYVITDGSGINSIDPYDDERTDYVKYKFTGETLEIHLYLHFITSSIKKEKIVWENADKVEYTNGVNYKNLFIKGLFHTFHNKLIKGSANDFIPGFNITTKLIVHDKNTCSAFSTPSQKSKDTFLKRQEFLTISLGGICSVDYDNNEKQSYWYHFDLSPHPTIKYSSANIYMPTYSQVLSNGKIPYEADEIVHQVAGHEAGHALGLDDAYRSRFGTDRMTNNNETCILANTPYFDNWQNMMYCNNYIMNYYNINPYLLPNDLEMMLHKMVPLEIKEFNESSGLESYKLYREENETYKISPVIKNKNDLWKE